VGATQCALTCVALFWCAAGTSIGAIRFEDFGAAQKLSLVGEAKVSGKALRLTSAAEDQSGAAWFSEKQPVATGFETTFQFQITQAGGTGHGADGFAFVLQNSGPEAVGGRGSAGGFAVEDPDFRHRRKIPIAWSLAVFFDTYRNKDEGDPSNNYVAFRTYGKPGDLRWPAARLAFTPNLPVNLKDGKVHKARIRFRPPVLSVFLDDHLAPVLESIVDLSIVLDRQGAAWVGFTASTGGGYANHDILNWSFAEANVTSSMSVVTSQITFMMSACLPDRKLCTPERAIVERWEGGYHVVLPGNLEWGVRIPESPGRSVAVTNAHGIVCWDVKKQGSEECSGPAGIDMLARLGFLADDGGRLASEVA
jgi:hypothetical protein